MIEVKVLSEAGIYPALYGIGLSYGITSFDTEDIFEFNHKLMGIANKLKDKEGGEDKFLRMLVVYMAIRAPMYWWKQYDTYKVGTVAQSESTMHTLLKWPITQQCFSAPIPEEVRMHLEQMRILGKFDALVNELPMGWMQTRVVCLNYAVLQNIILRRKKHKLQEWRDFCELIYKHVRYPELLP